MKAIPLQTKDLFLLQEPFLEKRHSVDSKVAERPSLGLYELS